MNEAGFCIMDRKATNSLIASRFLLMVYIVCLGYVSLSPISEGQAAPTVPRRVLNNLLHVPAYAVLAFLMGLSFKRERSRQLQIPGLFVPVLCALAFGALMEMGQVFVPGRTFDVGDMALNGFGAALGAVMYALLVRTATAEGAGEYDGRGRGVSG